MGKQEVQGLGLVGKKESQGSGGAPNPAPEPVWGPPDAPGAHPHKPAPQVSFRLSTSRATPALLLLLVLILLFSSPSFRQWLGSADNIPAQVSAAIWKKPSSVPASNMSVWTKQQFGFYYCQGDVLFGRAPGKLMTQSDALGAGFRPAGDQYCADSKSNQVSTGSLYLHKLLGVK